MIYDWMILKHTSLESICSKLLHNFFQKSKDILFISNLKIQECFKHLSVRNVNNNLYSCLLPESDTNSVCF